MRYEDWHELRHSPDELHNSTNNVDPRDIINPNGPEIILGIYNAITNKELTRFYIKAYDKEGAFYILRHSKYAWVYDDEDLLVKYIGTTADQPKNSVNENKYDFDLIDYEDDEQEILNHQTITKTVYKYFPKNKRELKKYMEMMIQNKDYNLNRIDVSRIYDFSYLFYSWKGIVSKLDIRYWDVSNGVNFSYMFEGCSKFNTDISNWDVSNGRLFTNMFDGCVKFNQDLSGWDVSRGEIFKSMFSNCIEFNQDLSCWNMSNAWDVENMFYRTYNLQYKNKIEYIWKEVHGWLHGSDDKSILF